MDTAVKRWAVCMGLFLAVGAAGTQLHAQDVVGERVFPSNQVVITGYGTVGYAIETQGVNENAFNSSISPIFLFQFQDRILFEVEFEFELKEGITETGLEYAQLDYIANDNLTFVGGKFLLPFGVFGERLHPTWINKFATMPPIFGHHVSSFGASPLLPIMSDVGVMARGVLASGSAQLGLNVYVVQGPAADDLTAATPELEFPASSGDNNTGKAFGGRLDFALRPWIELNASFLNGDYDDQNVLDLTAWNLAGEFHLRNFEIRGEYVQTRQEVERLTGFPSLVRDGFYAQVAYRIGSWEPVVRWTQVFDSELGGVLEDQGAWQFGLGLDYWFNPSIAFMSAYEINREDGPELDNDRLVVHLAFGF